MKNQEFKVGPHNQIYSIIRGHESEKKQLAERSHGAGRYAAATILGVAIMALSGCFKQDDVRHAFVIKGGGQVSPAAGAQFRYYPGMSKADFFYEPIQTAYQAATSNLANELLPLCPDARTFLDGESAESEQVVEELKESGGIPLGGCGTIENESAELNTQLAQSRIQFDQKIAELQAKASEYEAERAPLQARVDQQLGSLRTSQQRLEQERQTEIKQRAKDLRSKALSEIEVDISYDDREYGFCTIIGQADLVIINGSQYDLGTGSYQITAYKGGEKLNDFVVTNYSTATDDLGFQTGTSLAAGRSYKASFGYVPVRSDTPEGRLFAQQTGLKFEKCGYSSSSAIRPDRFVVNGFIGEFFIPDAKPTTEGNRRVYRPKKVDWDAIAINAGEFSQDAELKSVADEIQSFKLPESARINEIDAELRANRSQIVQLQTDFANSDLQRQLNTKIEAMDRCEVDSKKLEQANQTSARLASLIKSISTCETPGEFDGPAVFGVMQTLNIEFDQLLPIPEVGESFRVQARSNILSAFVDSEQRISYLGLNGDFRAPAGKGVVLTSYKDNFNDGFWFVDEAELASFHDLDNKLMREGSLSELITSVIDDGCAPCDFGTFSESVSLESSYYDELQILKTIAESEAALITQSDSMKNENEAEE